MERLGKIAKIITRLISVVSKLIKQAGAGVVPSSGLDKKLS